MGKINYETEDYKTELISIVLIIIFCMLVIGIILTTAIKIKSIDIIGITYILIIIICIGPVLSIKIRNYIAKKNRRDLNISIMKNGVCIDGKIVSIKDNSFYSITSRQTYHNITCEITYMFNGEPQRTTVDNLKINYKKIESYLYKQVKVYIYNNNTYIDVLN